MFYALFYNNVYAQVRQLLKFPKKGRRVCWVRENIRLLDMGYYKDRTLGEVIRLASVRVCPEWWVRYTNEDGDASELQDKAASVQDRRHRRETQWVKTLAGLRAEKLDRVVNFSGHVRKICMSSCANRCARVCKATCVLDVSAKGGVQILAPPPGQRGLMSSNIVLIYVSGVDVT